MGKEHIPPSIPTRATHPPPTSPPPLPHVTPAGDLQANGPRERNTNFLSLFFFAFRTFVSSIFLNLQIPPLPTT